MEDKVVNKLKTISRFRGLYRPLSNFAFGLIEFEGIWYPTAEHAFQAAKTLSMSKRHQIARLGKASEAKKEGRSLELRSDWELVKLDIMYNIVFKKFTTIEAYRDLLLSTGDAELIEGNTWGDTYWGVCNAVGENHLGKILMRVRAFLKENYCE